MVQLLLAAKADVDFQEPILKQNSLQIASSNGHAPLVALFLKSPHKQLELAKFNALTAALSFGRQSCARLLLENKASFNTADWSTVDGCTKIFILQRYKNECIGIVREVLDGSYRSQKNELMNNLPVRVINQYKDQAIMPSESIELINEYANLYGKDAKRATLKQAIVVAKQLVGNSNGFFDNGIDDSSHNGVCVGDMLVPQKKVRDKDLCIIA
ncbi:MAG: ankyrin repeat domain-containing protein [Candidatus Dependentiae bacterium]|nr:ankyrin repeat domain-containing protein [Candidatus Dependentiae bacterium]